jgi:hypothetical protein
MSSRTVIVGFSKNINIQPGSILIEGISERIDYIRSNGLEKKFNFTLIPKFVTNKKTTQVSVFIQKIDILTSLRNKKKAPKFGHVQLTPFYDSKEILVTSVRLATIPNIHKLVINCSNYSNILNILQSLDNQIYNISEILLKPTTMYGVTPFLKEHYFEESESTEGGSYQIFKNKKPNIINLTFKDPSELLEYTTLESKDKTPADFYTIGDTQYQISYERFYPPVHQTLYIKRSTANSNRIKDAIIYGSTETMIELSKILTSKKILFFDTLKGYHFLLHEES